MDSAAVFASALTSALSSFAYHVECGDPSTAAVLRETCELLIAQPVAVALSGDGRWRRLLLWNSLLCAVSGNPKAGAQDRRTATQFAAAYLGDARRRFELSTCIYEVTQ